MRMNGPGAAGAAGRIRALGAARCGRAVSAGLFALAVAACGTLPRYVEGPPAGQMAHAIVPLAEAALDAGQAETATRLYRRLLAAEPGSFPARMGLGDTALREGASAEAARWYGDAVRHARRPPERHAALLAHARAALASGDLAAARWSFARLTEPAERAAPAELAWGFNGVGLARLLEGDIGAAVAAMEEAVRIAPEERRFRENLARARAALRGIPRDAARPAEATPATAPRATAATRNAGSVRARAGRGSGPGPGRRPTDAEDADARAVVPAAVPEQSIPAPPPVRATDAESREDPTDAGSGADVSRAGDAETAGDGEHDERAEDGRGARRGAAGEGLVEVTDADGGADAESAGDAPPAEEDAAGERDADPVEDANAAAPAGAGDAEAAESAGDVEAARDAGAAERVGNVVDEVGEGGEAAGPAGDESAEDTLDGGHRGSRGRGTGRSGRGAWGRSARGPLHGPGRTHGGEHEPQARGAAAAGDVRGGFRGGRSAGRGRRYRALTGAGALQNERRGAPCAGWLWGPGCFPANSNGLRHRIWRHIPVPRQESS